MKRLLLFLLVLTAISLNACRSVAPTPPMWELPAGTEAAAMPPIFGAAGGAPAMPESFIPPSDLSRIKTQDQVSNGDRLVIKNADLSIVVKDVNARIEAIQDMANAMGGFVVSASIYQTSARDGTPVPQGQIVVRVPQERLDEALDEIKKDTVEVQNENRSGQDVTDQYVDLQSQLKAKQAAADQLLSIMKEARRTEDVLAVYIQLQQIESEIEVLKGQIKYTEQAASLSAISVTIVAEETVKPIEVGGWKPQGVARDAIQNLIYFWQGFVDFVIRFVLYVLPVLVTIGIPLFLVFLLVRWILRKLSISTAKLPPRAPKK